MQKIFTRAAAWLAACGLLAALPVQAADVGQAEKVRRLDVMLMVTALRCRTTADNFQTDFAAFEAAHLTELNAAAAVLRTDLATRHGAAGANRALDRISTGMANQYGQGHPWLNCAELKSVTRGLASMRGKTVLLEAADQLLSPQGSGAQIAWARR